MFFITYLGNVVFIFWLICYNKVPKRKDSTELVK